MLAQSACHDLASFYFKSLPFFRFKIDNCSLKICLELLSPRFLKSFVLVPVNYLNSLHVLHSFVSQLSAKKDCECLFQHLGSRIVLLSSNLFAFFKNTSWLWHHQNFCITQGVQILPKSLHLSEHNLFRQRSKVFCSFIHLVVSLLGVPWGQEFILSVEFLPLFSDWKVFLF